MSSSSSPKHSNSKPRYQPAADLENVVEEHTKFAELCKSAHAYVQQHPGEIKSWLDLFEADVEEEFDQTSYASKVDFLSRDSPPTSTPLSRLLELSSSSLFLFLCPYYCIPHIRTYVCPPMHSPDRP